MDKPHVILLNDTAVELAQKLAKITGGTVEGAARRCKKTPVVFNNVKDRLCELFNKGTPIIAIMAAGAVMRILAQELKDKQNEPPVIVVSEDGKHIVPLIGGHHGANNMAREIAENLEAVAAITTSGDLRFGISLDEPPAGYMLANPNNTQNVMGALAAGANVKLNGKSDWLSKSSLPFSDQGEVILTVSERKREADEQELIYHPKNLVLGIGCEREAGISEALALVDRVIQSNDINKNCISAVCSIDVKSDEAAVHAVAAHLGVGVRFFGAPTLELERENLHNPSEVVFREVGCHGVAEGAALAGVSENNTGTLIVEKTKSKRVTCAIAKSDRIVVPTKLGRTRGTLFVVGIGPGSSEWRSPEVTGMIGKATDLVGYSLYLELIDEISAGKIRHDFALGREEDRVRHAMELAGEGKDVALVCSGDAGIYAMATLVFELLARGGLSDSAQRIAIEVSPGISALQAAAARAGAPLGHDFCTISLSDLLTPWTDIQKRVTAAAEGDFVIAFYNPVSKKRKKQLAYAKAKLLEYRPPDTPVVLASNLGRGAEEMHIVKLKDLNISDVDMLTVVIVGSSNSQCIKTGDGRNWVYTPRGYSAKQSSGISNEAGS